MSVTTTNLFGNILLKSVKIPFSGNTEILGFKKILQFFHEVLNSFLFKNWYSLDCKEPFKPKRKVKFYFFKKNTIFDPTLQFLRFKKKN